MRYGFKLSCAMHLGHLYTMVALARYEFKLLCAISLGFYCDSINLLCYYAATTGYVT
jgi:hypothetical protein